MSSKKGKLIIIEGGDGSGKATQSERLVQRLVAEGYKAIKITFPDYESDSSALIKMYLGGEFGDTVDSVNPYAASTFYTVDRFASFTKYWGELYREGTIVVADRYTTSNLVHQGAKIKDATERQVYYDWLEEFEYQRFGLPKPDAILFLDVPPEVSQQWMQNRQNKMDGSLEKDIHERDVTYLKQAHAVAMELCQLKSWDRISVTEEGQLLNIDAVHERVWDKVSPLLKEMPMEVEK